MNLRFSRRAKGLLLLSATAVLPVAVAFNLDGERWLDGQTTFYVGMPGVSASGKSWSSALRDAAQQWTDRSDFTFIVDDGYRNPCQGYSRNSRGSGFPAGRGDDQNGADFRRDVCGNAFGDGVLAIALTLSEGGTLGFGHIVQSDIVFNQNEPWDVYSGPLRFGSRDFGRVALHELGHVLGLNHETQTEAIMAPTITNLNSLQPDDIAGANSIYGEPTRCRIAELPLNAYVRDSLQQEDCRVLDLYGGGRDTSFVDAYRLRLTETTRLRIAMQSAQVDSVLILTDRNLKSLAVDDDFQGTCNARLDTTLPAGEYLLLANTYDVPEKCVGNTGPYTISITDTALPQLGHAANTVGGELAAALFNGGATADGGVNYRQQFSANEGIDVDAQIAVDGEHVGLPGKVYVLAMLGNGPSYVQNSQGTFVPFSGVLTDMPAHRVGNLAAVEKITVIKGLRGRATGLAGQSVSVYVGYALDSNPAEIHFGSDPITFTIGP